MQLSPYPQLQFLDDNGDPLAGGKLYSYEAGTSTPFDTYSNQTGTSNTNPVILDSAGRADVWLDPAQSYKLVLDDSDDVQVWEVDNIDYLPDNIVTTAKIAALAVTTAKLAANAVTTAKITDLNVTTAKLAADAVTNAKLADDAVQEENILDGAVTPDKQAARNTEVSTTTTGAHSETSTSEQDVTNLTKSITTNGRDVLIFVQPDGSSSSSILSDDNSGTSASGTAKIYRDAAEIASFDIGIGVPGSTSAGFFIPPGAIMFLDEAPAAATYTYKITAKVGVTNDLLNFTNCKLVCVEL